MDLSLSVLRELVMDREAWRAAIHGVAVSDWSDLIWSDLPVKKISQKKMFSQVFIQGEIFFNDILVWVSYLYTLKIVYKNVYFF